MRARSLAEGSLFAALLFLAACSRGTAPAGAAALGPCPDAGARLAVSATGQVTLNGAPVAPPALAITLRSLNPPPLLVCYYREAGSAPAVPAVLDAAMSMRLPVLVFEDAAFSRPAKQ